jgi:endonuclease/exonuclease/phosphatase family metal-dependent hydrolase
MTDTLHIATYNIHKGLSFFKRRLVIHEVREHLRLINADLLFLQEVQGDHARQARRFDNWPDQSQHEFIADSVWTDFAYGRNAVYDAGHHGNAILSRFPIARWDNEDISEHRFESRGLLHCEMKVPGWDQDLHCVCVHLALTARHRSRQMRSLRLRIERLVPEGAPLIVAGDFNDWARHATEELARPLGMREVFEQHFGRLARSFPAALPVFHLDRIYVRGFNVKDARVHHGHPWTRISDHAALTTTIIRL